MLEAVDSERELLDRLEGGDEAAVDALFDLHAGTLRAYARRWLPRRLDRKVSVADVMQEARLVALRRSGDFQDRGENAFRNWLLRIVEYKVKEEIRRYGRAKRAVQREITRGARPVTADFAVGGPSPSEAACGNEQRELAEHAMAQLTDYQRDVLRLSCEEHLTFREIAARLGHSYESVKKTYGRAVSRFSEEFERLQGDGCE
jgi:RNA polymerase sigma-70 factor (subfamily 1)